jgi:hypothetical protein
MLRWKASLKPASGGSAYAYGPEGFEGTGAPTGFTSTIVGSGTVDYDDTSDPGTGLQSLKVVTSGGDSYAELDLGAEYSNFTLIWQEKIIGSGQNRSWIKMSPSSAFTTNSTATIGNSSWQWCFIQNFTTFIPTTNNVSIGAWQQSQRHLISPTPIQTHRHPLIFVQILRVSDICDLVG